LYSVDTALARPICSPLHETALLTPACDVVLPAARPSISGVPWRQADTIAGIGAGGGTGPSAPLPAQAQPDQRRHVLGLLRGPVHGLHDVAGRRPHLQPVLQRRHEAHRMAELRPNLAARGIALRPTDDPRDADAGACMCCLQRRSGAFEASARHCGALECMSGRPMSSMRLRFSAIGSVLKLQGLTAWTLPSAPPSWLAPLCHSSRSSVLSSGPTFPSQPIGRPMCGSAWLSRAAQAAGSRVTTRRSSAPAVPGRDAVAARRLGETDIVEQDHRHVRRAGGHSGCGPCGAAVSDAVEPTARPTTIVRTSSIAFCVPEASPSVMSIWLQFKPGYTTIDRSRSNALRAPA
jgi:hypothetical protein